MSILARTRSLLRHSARPRRALLLLTLMLIGLAASAQVSTIPKVGRNMQIVLEVVFGLSVVTFTILFVWCGIEIGARHRKLIDVWQPIAGATVAGCAAVVAALLIN